MIMSPLHCETQVTWENLTINNNKIENVWRLYFTNGGIHGGQNPGHQYLYFIF